jgi:septal ring factor EnvC (AmiA/AmiB activator)
VLSVTGEKRNANATMIVARIRDRLSRIREKEFIWVRTHYCLVFATKYEYSFSLRMSFDLGTCANVAIAIFTAVTAVAAWRAASLAKSSAKQASDVAKEQTKVSVTAPKANALASRINFYNEQIADIKEAINKMKSAPVPISQFIAHSEQRLEELKMQACTQSHGSRLKSS